MQEVYKRPKAELISEGVERIRNADHIGVSTPYDALYKPLWKLSRHQIGHLYDMDESGPKDLLIHHAATAASTSLVNATV